MSSVSLARRRNRPIRRLPLRVKETREGVRPCGGVRPRSPFGLFNRPRNKGAAFVEIAQVAKTDHLRYGIAHGGAFVRPADDADAAHKD